MASATETVVRALPDAVDPPNRASPGPPLPEPPLEQPASASTAAAPHHAVDLPKRPHRATIHHPKKSVRSVLRVDVRLLPEGGIGRGAPKRHRPYGASGFGPFVIEGCDGSGVAVGLGGTGVFGDGALGSGEVAGPLGSGDVTGLFVAPGCGIGFGCGFGCGPGGGDCTTGFGAVVGVGVGGGVVGGIGPVVVVGLGFVPGAGFSFVVGGGAGRIDLVGVGASAAGPVGPV